MASYRDVGEALGQRIDRGARVCAITRIPDPLLVWAARSVSASAVRAVYLNHSVTEASLGLPGGLSTLDGGCDLLIISLLDSSVMAHAREALLLGLPRLLRMVASPRNAVLILGHNCSSLGHQAQRYLVGGACMRVINRSTPIPAGVIRKGRLERYPCDALESCWLDRWHELHDQRELLGNGWCRRDADRGSRAGERAICIASIRQDRSLCDRFVPLLEDLEPDTVHWRPKDPAWQSNRKWKRAVMRRLQRSLRYLTVLPCEDGQRTCLVFKDDLQETFVAAISSSNGLLFDSAPTLVLPRKRPVALRNRTRGGHGRRSVAYALSSHNLALTFVNDTYVLVGGRYRPDANQQEPEQGIWVSSSKRLAYSEGRHLMRGSHFHIDPNGLNGATLRRVRDAQAAGPTEPVPWTAPRLVLLGGHPGCVERRRSDALRWVGVPPGTCEFDGRLSLAHFRGRFWLFARANLASTGQRFVQVTSSTDSLEWLPFQLITLQEYSPPLGDLYFFAAQPNPADTGSMLAVFPVVHRARACICLAFSRDAVRWSPPRPLLRCESAGERSVDQPAVGMLRRADHVFLYIHKNVPQIREDAKTPEALRIRLRQLRHLTEPRIVRYAIPVVELQRWTEEGLRSLDR